MPTSVKTFAAGDYAWQDTGFVVPGTQLATMTATCVGDVFYGPDGQPGTVAPYVNGSGNLNGPGYNASYSPTFTLADFPVLPASTAPVNLPGQIRTYAIVLLFVPDGTGPNPVPKHGGTQHNSNVFSFDYHPTVEVNPGTGTDTVSRSFTSADFSGFSPGTNYRCWAVNNDPYTLDNVGTFTLTLTYCFVPQTVPVVVGSFSMDASNCTITDLLTWPALGDATGYQIKRDGVTLGTTAGTSYPDTAVSQGVTYSYVVTPFNTCGVGLPSVAVSITPDTGMVSAPTACQPCCETRAIVRWDEALCLLLSGHPAATLYEVWRQVNGGGYVYVRTFFANDTRRYLDVDVSVGSVYDYQVRPFYGCFYGIGGIASLTVSGFTGDSVPATAYTSDSPVSTTYTSDSVPSTVYSDPDVCTCD